jgi:hypothetical protein
MTKKSSLLALLLLVPAPSIGVLAGMVIAPDRVLGKSVFFISKLWILLIPIFWWVVIARQKLSWEVVPLVVEIHAVGNGFIV